MPARAPLVRRASYCALALLALTRTTFARDGGRRLPVDLIVDPCTSTSPSFLGHVLTVELGVAINAVPSGEASDTGKSDVTTVTLSCDEGTIHITVRDPISGKTVERSIDLRAERAPARPRLLGLSTAELIAASWLEPEVIPRPAAPVVEATAPPAVRREAAEAARTMIARRAPMPWDIDAVVVGRRFADAEFTTWGGGVAGSWAYRGWFTFGADALAEGGSLVIESGGLALGSATVFTASGRLSAGLRHRWESVAVEAAVGGRLMWTRLRGSADQAPRPDFWNGHTFSGTWGGPVVEVRLGWRVFRSAFLVASAEGGTATRHLTGLVAKRPDVSLSGSWAALSLGFGWSGDAFGAP